ncbi:MAG TPA: hypothetical protein VD948_06450 [Rhodothermales bacterium]|nr:hypothetical protein [Rhodothermales bacterium]
MYLVLLDDYHLDDLLFLNTLGRLMSAAPRPAVLIHGDGGLAARALEAKGYFEGDVLPPEAVAQVAAAHQQQNRRLVGALNDHGVPVVGLLGSDRRLLVQTAGGEVLAGKTGWLTDLVARGVVPVVAALALDGAQVPVVVPAAAALRALRTALGGTAVVFTRTGRAGLGAQPEAALPAERLGAHDAELADAKAARTLAEEALLVTSPPGFWGKDGPSGTEIRSEGPKKAV